MEDELFYGRGVVERGARRWENQWAVCAGADPTHPVRRERKSGEKRIERRRLEYGRYRGVQRGKKVGGAGASPSPGRSGPPRPRRLPSSTRPLTIAVPVTTLATGEDACRLYETDTTLNADVIIINTATVIIFNGASENITAATIYITDMCIVL